MRDIFIITAGRALAILVSIVSIRFFTTLLTPAEVGRLNIILAMTGWFGLVLINPPGMYMNRKIIEWNRQGALLKYLRYWIFYLALVAIFAVLLISAVHTFIGTGIDIKFGWLVLIVLGSVLFGSGYSSSVSYINLLGRRFWFVIISNAGLWMSLLLSVLFAQLFYA